ncbi:hypothetical protein EVAR_93746_1 [Eumeta japonica]|uniref:Ig-like domain-containing protein n=1 Tax=Eumeta variegata TaxID=151549 RepID=A0A4C1U2U4_EUMVA|nr:hypothetical protein EVAR_93746_1 [Eumeta japonica]
MCSFDVRGKPLSEGQHWSAPGVFGPRAHFVTSPPPAALHVRDVKRRDEGVYRCRVDFRNTQTTSFRYNLTVVEQSDTRRRGVPARPGDPSASGGADAASLTSKIYVKSTLILLPPDSPTLDYALIEHPCIIPAITGLLGVIGK